MLLIDQLPQTVLSIFSDILFDLKSVRPFKLSRYIKASLKIFNFPTTKGFKMKISTKLFLQYVAIFFHPPQVIFMHTIATAIRGL